jgi:CBS domain-containing protein
MRVRDIMTRTVYAVSPDVPVESAAELMIMHEVTALPVTDAGGHLVGMVSDSDLLWHRVPADPGNEPEYRPDTDPVPRPGVVLEAMSEYPVTTAPSDDVADAAQLMLEHDVRSLPVLDGRMLVGIVSRRDILKAMVRDDRTLAVEVQLRLDAYAGRPGLWTAEVDAGVATICGRFPNDQQRATVAILARAVPGVAAVLLDPEIGPDGTVTGEMAVMT